MSEIKIKTFARTGNVNRRILMVSAVVVVVILVLGLGVLVEYQKSRQAHLDTGSDANKLAHVLEQRKNISARHLLSDFGNQDRFVIPEDAIKSGQIALVVDSLETAKGVINSIATKNSGSIYWSSISYAENNLKNGEVVVQIPSDNFDVVFQDLKKIGSQIVQESTRQIPVRSYPYPIIIPMEKNAIESQENTVGDANDAVAVKEDENDQDSDSTVTKEISTAMPTMSMLAQYNQPVQNKGYIKIIFVDYGENVGAINNKQNFQNPGFFMNYGYYGQNFRDNIWLVLAIKSILLIVLIFVLVIIAKKIMLNFKKINKNKAVVNNVKQLSKKSIKAIRIKKK
jgi:hypothetical protein